MKDLKLLYAGTDLLPVSSEHFCRFYRDKGAKIEAQKLDVTEASQLEEAVKAAGPADGVRIDLGLSVEWLKHSGLQSLDVSRFRAADFFFWKNNRWEPELFLVEGLRRVIVRQAHHLDLKSSAYVVGQGPCLRAVAGLVINLGFQKVWLVGVDPVDMEEQKEILMRLYLDPQISTLSSQALTLQTVGGSLLVNTLHLSTRPELAGDLAYFNFMNQGGLVLDLSSGRDDQNVLEEATRAGLRVLPPADITAQNDLLLAKRWGLDSLSTEAEYLESWQKELNSLGKEKS